MRDPADDNDHWEPVHCHHCDACRRVWLGMHTSATGVLWTEGHCPACERDAWWDEAFQRQARTAEQYRAEGRAEERERLAAMVEALPVMTSYPAPDAHNLAYRYTTPRTVAAKIRGEA